MSGDFYVDDLVSRSLSAPRPVRWWERVLRLRCRAHDYVPPIEILVVNHERVRCERRAGHPGQHRHGDHTWGMLDVPFLPDSPHFRAWAQTCPLNEWVRYEGPIGDSRWMACDVYMTERPDPPSSTRKTNRGYGRGS